MSSFWRTSHSCTQTLKSMFSCFMFPHIIQTHTHAQTNVCTEGLLWIHYYYSEIQKKDRRWFIQAGRGRCSSCDLLIIQLIHLPLEMDTNSSTCQCVTETLKWKIHLLVPWGITLAQFVYSASPRPLPQTCMHIYIPLPCSLHPPSILCLVTTPPGCLCQFSSRNCLVKSGWKNL